MKRACVLLLWLLVCAMPCQAQTAAALRQKLAAIETSLQQTRFGQPLQLDSGESKSNAHGDIFAVMNYPFASVSMALNNPEHWCDVMLLHINTKYCHAQITPAGTRLRIYLGKKTPEPLSSATRLDFRYGVLTANNEYLSIALLAPTGPMGTSDYRITLEAVASGNGKTFLHLGYAWSSGFAGRLAMQTYLNTLGSGKVGFSPAEGGKAGKDGGKANYIGGIRGLAERNTMRYYLAIDSYLDSLNVAPADQLDARLQRWYTAVERYPVQLHEIEREAYMSMKHEEHLRQQTLQ